MAGESVGKRGVWFFALDLAWNCVECVAFAALVGAGERMKALFCYIRREKHISSWRNVPTKHLKSFAYCVVCGMGNRVNHPILNSDRFIGDQVGTKPYRRVKRTK